MKILLQVKFIMVAGLNFLYSLIPLFFIRKIFLFVVGVHIGKNSYIHRGVKFFHIGNVRMGSNSVVNFGCYLDNRRGIFIGNNVGIAHNCKIYTLGHDVNDSCFRTKGAPVYLKDNVFVFSNVIIMPGITIGEGAIVLPGSIVTKDVAEYTIVGGNPAKYVRSRERNIQYKLDYGYWFAL